MSPWVGPTVPQPSARPAGHLLLLQLLTGQFNGCSFALPRYAFTSDVIPSKVMGKQGGRANETSSSGQGPRPAHIPSVLRSPRLT